MIELRIDYPTFREYVAAEPEGTSYRLTAHSLLIPLAPGDLVTTEGGVLTGVDTLAETFTIEAYFPVTTQPRVVAEKAAEWARATWVTRSTMLTVLVTSSSHAWLQEVVADDPLVQFVDPIRVPSQAFSFEQAVKLG